MSKFFKALEQAELDRALRDRTAEPEGNATETPPSTPPVERDGPPPARVPALPVAPKLSGDAVDDVEPHLVSLLMPTSFEAEQYRALRHTLEQLHKTSDLSIFAVSSPASGDGKTTTAINLAGALAQAPDARVLLVDADLRQSSVAQYLGLDNHMGHGLVDAVLNPDLTLADLARRRPPFNLSVITAGPRTSTPFEVLKSPRLHDLFTEARRQYEYIVLDTPPLVPFQDCRILGKWVDGFLVVVAAHKTPRTLLDEALKVMDPAKIVGLVFNTDDRPRSGYYDYAYGRSTNGNRSRRWGRAVRKGRDTGERRSYPPQGRDDS